MIITTLKELAYLSKLLDQKGSKEGIYGLLEGYV
jgi:hypothetical protein